MSQAVVMNIALEDYDLSQTVNNENVNGNEEAHANEAQTLYTLFRNRMNVVKVAAGTDFNTTNGDADQYTIISLGDDGDYGAFRNNHSTEGYPTTNDFPQITAGGTWGNDATLMFFNDGITFIFNNIQSECTAQTNTNSGDHYCFGFIDVNGQKAPNRVIACDANSKTEGGNDGDDDLACVVSNPTDIYPIAMYDQSIVPASAAARAVLYAK